MYGNTQLLYVDIGYIIVIIKACFIIQFRLLLLEQAITSGFIGTIYLALESRNSQL